MFSHEDALNYKRLLRERLEAWGVALVDLESVLPDGIVRDQMHLGPVVEHFRRAGIDGLFIPHCNFGTEGAAAMIAKRCDVPTLLWAPRDEAPLPDGARLRDSLCGSLATSGVLNVLQVPFSYIENCRVDDEPLRRGVDRFVRAVGVVKKLRSMRIGLVGQRIDFFWSTLVNEADILQRFGIEVLPIDLTNTIREIKNRVEANRTAYEAELAEDRQMVRFNHFPDDTAILANYAFRDILVEAAKRQSLDGIAVQSFDSIGKELGCFLSYGVSLACDLGVPIAPESDVYGAISSVLLEAASGADRPSFLPDITIRHPANDNAVLLWHADAPLSLRANDFVKVDLPWILTGQPTGLVHFKLQDGPLTLCRFAGDAQNGYRLGFGEGHTTEGPYTQEFYTWMEVDNWPKWERQLIEGPYIHHCSCVFEHCADVFAEAARFLPELEFERFGKG